MPTSRDGGPWVPSWIPISVNPDVGRGWVRVKRWADPPVAHGTATWYFLSTGYKGQEYSIENGVIVGETTWKSDGSVRDSYRLFAAYLDERGEGELLERLQYVDTKIYLPDDILVKVDRTSMANSLELRVPFLDHETVSFLFSLPSRLRMRGLEKKYILKQAVKGLLPPRIIGGRKRGFNVPVARWLRSVSTSNSS